MRERERDRERAMGTWVKKERDIGRAWSTLVEGGKE